MSKAPEAALVYSARDGDQDAYGELITRYQSWLRNLMRRLSNDATLADDLAQQAFLQAWKSLHSLTDVKRFSGWLRQIAVNNWLQQQRKHDSLRHAAELDNETASTESDPLLKHDLEWALTQLPEAQRTAIVLSYTERMTHPEIADIMQLPMGTVKSNIRRGTDILRDLLKAWETAK